MSGEWEDSERQSDSEASYQWQGGLPSVTLRLLSTAQVSAH